MPRRGRRHSSNPFAPARTKYNARKAIVDNITFDSAKEADRYLQLKLLQRAGKISDLQLKVPFELIPKQGKLQPIRYTADFVYTDTATGARVVEDSKGHRTRDYIMRKKMMLFFHEIEILET